MNQVTHVTRMFIDIRCDMYQHGTKPPDTPSDTVPAPPPLGPAPRRRAPMADVRCVHGPLGLHDEDFHGDCHGIANGINWWFNGILWGFNGISMGFYGDQMGYEWDIASGNDCDSLQLEAMASSFEFVSH